MSTDIYLFLHTSDYTTNPFPAIHVGISISCQARIWHPKSTTLRLKAFLMKINKISY